MHTNTTDNGVAAPARSARRLLRIRGEIDAIDENLLDLLNKRAQCSLEIGAIKSVQGDPVYRPGREQLLLENLLERNGGPLPDTHLRHIYREILSSSRLLQQPLRVAFLGPEGTFSHMAGLEFFGKSLDYHPMQHIEHIFEAVENRDCELGIVPLENSLHGTVARSVDLFAEHEVYIQAEWFSRISHSLLSREENMAAVATVYSHPQPLGQCAIWLREHLPRARQVSLESTAAAAHRVLSEPGAAAVAHGGLASRLGLGVLARRIEDASDNWTRFAAIAPTPSEHDGADKTSVLFTLADKPGSLSAVLDVFAGAGINMNKLESRPAKRERWKYVFFCDLAVDLTAPEHEALLENVRGHCHSFRILGAYPSGNDLQPEGSR
jgi:chorismate mutase/prephenate dehydratase